MAYETEVTTVRVLTADQGATPLMSDDSLVALLTLHDGNVHRAAADALRAVAASEILVSKKIRTQDLSTDGPAVSAELRALAAVFDSKADAAEAEAYFEFIPLGTERVEGTEWRL